MRTKSWTKDSSVWRFDMHDLEKKSEVLDYFFAHPPSNH